MSQHLQSPGAKPYQIRAPYSFAGVQATQTLDLVHQIKCAIKSRKFIIRALIPAGWLQDACATVTTSEQTTSLSVMNHYITLT